MAGNQLIVVAEALSEPALARLALAGRVERLQQPDEAALRDAVQQADALVVRTYAQVNANIIQAARQAGRLKVIARAGVGLDNIDLRAAQQAGIQVVYTPAASIDAVADLVVGLVIALQRKIVTNDIQMRSGDFASLRAGIPEWLELQHQTIGVIGMGRIGKAVGRRFSAGFNCKIIYHDIIDVGPLQFPAQSHATAQAVYAEADVVTFHVPLTKRTRGMVNRDSLARFKKRSYLVNASRGPVVEADALREALECGHLAGAAIDVFEPEPPAPNHPLMGAPNCILSPHVASRSKEAITAMNDVVDDVIRVLRGEKPLYPADFTDLE